MSVGRAWSMSVEAVRLLTLAPDATLRLMRLAVLIAYTIAMIGLPVGNLFRDETPESGASPWCRCSTKSQQSGTCCCAKDRSANEPAGCCAARAKPTKVRSCCASKQAAKTDSKSKPAPNEQAAWKSRCLCGPGETGLLVCNEPRILPKAFVVMEPRIACEQVLPATLSLEFGERPEPPVPPPKRLA